MKQPAKSPRKKCECGCGEFPASVKSRFKPGHDAKLAHKLRVAEAAKKSPRKKPAKPKRELAAH